MPAMAALMEMIDGIPLAGLMLVCALGFSLGRVRVRGLSLGPSAAALLSALLLGHLGLGATLPPTEGVTLGTFGFALFIYSVGFDAAPQVATALRRGRGLLFVLVAALVNLLAVIGTCACAIYWSIDPFTAAGILAGALTSPPTYAAAATMTPDPAAVSLVFALTYPLGLVGVVLMIQLLPRVFKDELTQDAASDDELSLRERSRYRPRAGLAPEVTRSFVVTVDEAIDRPLQELDLSHGSGCVISRIHRREDDSIVIPFGETELRRGDRVVVTGRFDELHRFEEMVGPEAYDQELHEPRFPSRRVLISHHLKGGTTLQKLNIARRYRCVVIRVRRGRLLLEPEAELELHRGDVLDVVGERDHVRRLAHALGRFEPAAQETDIALYAGGILFGVALGSLSFEVGGVTLGLGMAAGLLLVGLLLGSRPRWGPLRTHVPREARQLVRDLGILLFIGETGLRAGAHLEYGLAALSWQVFAAGAAVNLFVVSGTLAVGRLVLHLRPVDAWGSLSGGLTSSAALSAVRQVADSNEVAISYVTAYAFASVLATLAGPVVILLLS